MPISDEIRANNKVDYKQKYSNLKRKLKILIYENESYSEELRKSERQLLQVSRDKSYLLDRLLQYENIESSTSDSEDTLSSDSELESRKCDDSKRKKTTENITNELQTIGSTSKKKKTTNQSNSNRSKSTSTGKPSKPTSMASIVSTSGNTCSSSQTQSTTTPIIKIECPVMATCSQSSKTSSTSSVSSAIDGHMTSEELERHLESRRQPLAMLMPEKTPLTVPVELFSNESSSGLPDEDNNINLKISQLCSQ